MHMMHLAQVPTHLLELPWAAVPHQRFWGWSSGLLKLSGQLNATTSSNIPQISSNIYPQITHTRDYSIQRHQNSTTMTWSEYNYHVQNIKHTSQTQARAVVPAPVFHRCRWSNIRNNFLGVVQGWFTKNSVSGARWSEPNMLVDLAWQLPSCTQGRRRKQKKALGAIKSTWIRLVRTFPQGAGFQFLVVWSLETSEV